MIIANSLPKAQHHARLSSVQAPRPTTPDDPADTYDARNVEDLAVYSSIAVTAGAGAAVNYLQGVPAMVGGAIAMGALGVAVGSIISRSSDEPAQLGIGEVAGGLVGVAGGAFLASTYSAPALGHGLTLAGMLGGAMVGLIVTNALLSRVKTN